MPCMIGVSGGTTDPITIALMFERSSFSCAKSPVTIRPTSSAVRSRSVSSRQVTANRSPSKTPRTILVLPTSIARSIGSLNSRAQSTSPATIRSICPSTSTRRAPISSMPAVVPDRRSGWRLPLDARSAAARRTSVPRVENSIEPSFEQIRVARGHRRDRLRAERGAIDRTAKLGFERRGSIREFRRIRRRRDVDAVTEHGVTDHARRAADAFRQNARELPSSHHKIVRPFDLGREPGRAMDGVRERDSGGERQERRRALGRYARASGVEHHRHVQSRLRRREPVRPLRPRPAVCASARTIAPSP